MIDTLRLRLLSYSDFASLDTAGRRALHVHLPRANADTLEEVCAALVNGLAGR